MIRGFLNFLMSIALVGCISQQGDDQLIHLLDLEEEIVAPAQDTAFNTQARTVEGNTFDGYACSIVNSPGATPRWAIHQHNISTGEKTVLVAVNRNTRIQSAACSQDGELALFSMQESRGGDYEIYLVTKATAEVRKLTENDHNDIDVTASSLLDIAAWRTVHTDGRLVIDINKIGLDGTLTSIKTLGSQLPVFQPALSSSGRWLVFTQRSGLKYRIIRYQLSTDTSVQISQVRRSKRVYHPSVSDDGNLVGWVENKSKNLFLVKNVMTNVVHTYLNNPNGIEHAMLAGDGNAVIYGVIKKRRIFIKHLHTAAKFQIGEVLQAGQFYLGVSYAALPLSLATGKLNDTGITQCSGARTNGLSCPVAGYPDQDAQFGRDFNNNDDSDGYAGFSFTKLDANGNKLLANASEWSCVKDNVTGLIWEVKQGGNGVDGDEGLHDADDRYSWYSTETSNDGGKPGYQSDAVTSCYGHTSANATSYCSTEAYVNRVNLQSLCGSSSWRMPTREELRSIINYDSTDSGLRTDTEYFPDTKNRSYWSSSISAKKNSHAWSVDIIIHKKKYFYVRLVRDR